MNRIGLVTTTCLFVVALTQCHGAVISLQQPVFEHSVYLDSAEKVQLKWTHNTTYIIMQLQVKTLGWIAVGISPSGSMAGADIAAMWVNGDQTTIKDFSAETNGPPTLDQSQDLTLISGTQEDGMTTVSFGRNLTFCRENDRSITSDTLRLIYAYSDSLPSDGETLTSADKHDSDKRGSKSLRLLSEHRTPIARDASGISTVEFVQNKVSVPSKDTYYHCKIKKIDFGTADVHVVQFEPVIESGNEKYVHHMLVFLCSGLTTSTEADGNGVECYSDNMPNDYENCRSVVYTWAIGGLTFTYPDGVGFKIDQSEQTYFMIEMHYDNPDKRSDIVDSSGMRFYYTTQMRSQDVGFWEVGQRVDGYHFIPPRSDSWKTLANCSSECLNQGFTGESVKIFAVLLHAHTYGVSLKLRHFRNGKELKPISSESYYDFNYQEYNHLLEEVTFMKGDELVAECLYQTKNLAGTVYGGLSTKDEMCLAYIQFYPKTKNVRCLHKMEGSVVLGLLGSSNADEFENTIDSSSFSAGQIVKLNNDYNLAKYSVRCERGNENTVNYDKSHVSRVAYNDPGICQTTEDDSGTGHATSNVFTVLIFVLSVVAYNK